MEATQGHDHGGCHRPVTSPTASTVSASQAPVGSSFGHELFSNSIDYYGPYAGASVFSPFSDLQTLEFGFSQLGLSDSYAQYHHPPPLWNGGRSNQGFVDIETIDLGGYLVSPISQPEAEREQINQLQRLRFQNDCVNGSLGFDDSSHRSSLIGHDQMLSHGFHSGNLGEVPFLTRNSVDGSMFRSHNLRRNKVDSLLENSSSMTVMMAMNRMSYHQLRNAVVEGSRQRFDRVFSNVIFRIGELMVDPFAHHVVQKLIERCNDEQITQILVVITSNPFQLVDICNESHGTRTVKVLLRCLRSAEQKSIFMSALSLVALPLIKNTNGGHVILYCLSHFSPLFNMSLLEVVAQHCYQIAIDQHGCCTLQHCITHSTGELKQRLISEIIVNAPRLANHCYGNYLVQYVLLQVNDQRATSDLLRQLEGNYADLSRDKYGSHVVQTFLRHLREEDSRRIVFELLRDLSMLLIDPYGNYVVQTALVISKEDLRELLTACIRRNDQLMRCNRYGRKVLEKLHCL
ncbi:PREDICTED: putative pumilio homolog 13 [Tarenaya hassleriana]|uniref:putative pumilio homolog 13 n=1 Tax=Tarenaya hassleriana TaxID=28532 RepID=UPI00053C1CA1|nr:PREDICTED: putative pumilio homolog 13 [Tarenaya hassleriana]